MTFFPDSETCALKQKGYDDNYKSANFTIRFGHLHNVCCGSFYNFLAL